MPYIHFGYARASEAFPLVAYTIPRVRFLNSSHQDFIIAPISMEDVPRVRLQRYREDEDEEAEFEWLEVRRSRHETDGPVS